MSDGVSFAPSEGLLTVNDKAFKGAMATVAASFCGINNLFTDGMTKCQAKLMEQETLCVEAKNTLHQVLVRVEIKPCLVFFVWFFSLFSAVSSIFVHICIKRCEIFLDKYDSVLTGGA